LEKVLVMRDQEICKFKAEDHSLHHQVLDTKDTQDIFKLNMSCVCYFYASYCAHPSGLPRLLPMHW